MFLTRLKLACQLIIKRPDAEAALETNDANDFGHPPQDAARNLSD